MTIDEAIKRLEGEASLLMLRNFPKRWEAVRLGIEALKKIKEHQKWYLDSFTNLLPGETEE